MTTRNPATATKTATATDNLSHFDFEAEGTRLISYATGQVDRLRSQSAAVAAAIIAADDPAEAMARFFKATQRPYLAAKASKAKAKATALGRAWNALKPAVGYHLDKASKAAKWPAFTATDWSAADFSLITKAELAAERKAKAEHKAEAEAEALRDETAATNAAEAGRLQKLTAAELAAELASAIVCSTLTPADVLAELALVLGLAATEGDGNLG